MHLVATDSFVGIKSLDMPVVTPGENTSASSGGGGGGKAAAGGGGGGGGAVGPMASYAVHKEVALKPPDQLSADNKKDLEDAKPFLGLTDFEDILDTVKVSRAS
jgi:hypothetical protein